MGAVKTILQRSGLLTIERIAEMFCLKKETFLEKWHAGEPVIRDIELKKAGKLYVADERHVWAILEKYKDRLEPVTPNWRNESSRDRNNRIHRRPQRG